MLRERIHTIGTLQTAKPVVHKAWPICQGQFCPDRPLWLITGTVPACRLPNLNATRFYSKTMATTCRERKKKKTLPL